MNLLHLIPFKRVRTPAVRALGFVLMLFGCSIGAQAQNVRTFPLLQGPAAGLKTTTGEIAVFEPGERVFTDRDYEINQVPSGLRGFKFVRSSIDLVSVRCTRTGLVYVVTPAVGRNPASRASILLEEGFQQVKLPEVLLFQGNENRSLVFQKKMQAGETLELGKWAVVVLPEKHQAAAPARPLAVTGDGAQIRVLEQSAEEAMLTPGVKLFANRDHVLVKCPPVLQGRKFLRGRMEKLNFSCVRGGQVLVLMPDPASNPKDSRSKELEAAGFVRTAEPAFQLFGNGPGDKAVVYQKTMQPGEMMVLGKWAVLAGFDEYLPEPDLLASWPENTGELLYNGIRLPQTWPPRTVMAADDSPMPVPYLTHPPKLIPISLGRQLFVDDFLIADTTLEREYHHATKYESNPVMKPETPLELNEKGTAIATPKSGGVWWNPAQQGFQMWYEAGWLHATAYATSKDGLTWDRPNLDLKPGTNQVIPDDYPPDSSTVYIDYETKDPAQRYKMLLRKPYAKGNDGAWLMTSPDGIHWSKQVISGGMGDRTTMFYNPFRKKWVFALRDLYRARSRRYWEANDFLKDSYWKDGEPVLWLATDSLDKPDPDLNIKPQLYNTDAVAYESIVLGLFQIWFGPSNEECEKTGLPKITELQLMYSRDGFHWSRPDRNPFIRAERRDVWDRGYVQSVGGVCLVRGDKLWFYYIGFQGDETRKTGAGRPGHGMYDKGSTGIAFLRRDGFASMNAGQNPGLLTTRPVTFQGAQLFVNADVARGGGLRAEIIDEAGRPISPFTFANCEPVVSDGTILPVRWKGADDLSRLAGKPVQIRFEVKNGKFYSFWVSADKTGRSDGYVAAGGPGFTGATDTIGVGALEAEKKFRALPR
jgi:hypothetical protein